MNVKEKNIARFEAVDKALVRGVYFYGGGVNGRWCLEYMQRLGIEVVAFIDSNKQNHGRVIEGIPVVGMEEYEVGEKLPILITAKHAAAEIMLCHDVDMMMSFDAWFYMRHMREYEQLHFDDAEGGRVLEAILQYMQGGERDSLREIVCTEQYFWGSPFYNTGDEVFVDLGACTGDTIEKFLWAQNGIYKHIYAFEPGKRQLEAAELRKKRLVAEWALDADSITIEKKIVDMCDGEACWEDSTELLTTNHSTTAKEGGEKIACVSLDSYFADKRVTFIKADVEGSEYAALLGAKDILRRDKPKLAISVYHRPDDLLRIYHYLKELVPEYQVTLRHHSSKLMDTILYCWIA